MIPALFRSVTRYVDLCIYEHFFRDPEQLQKARILSGMLQLYLLMLGFIMTYLAFLLPTGFRSVLWAAALCTMLGTAYVHILWVLRTREAWDWCAEGTVLSTWLAVLVAIGCSGGPLHSPVVSALMLPVIIAFCLLGRTRGMVWANVIFIGHLLLLCVDQLVFPFPNWLDDQHLVAHHVVNWSIMYFAVTGLMLIFDTTHFKLKRERDTERQRYAFMASHDPLTGLANRMVFDHEIELAIARAERSGQPFAVMCLDLDDFKVVNDTYGHHAGDAVLQGVAMRLLDGLRKSDCVARMGGDEFAIILNGLGNEEEAASFARKIARWIREPFPAIGPDVRVGTSIGIALYPRHSTHAEQLCLYADDAMYRAKRQGQQWHVYKPSVTGPARDRSPEKPEPPLKAGWATGKNVT